MKKEVQIDVKGLTVGYGDYVLLHDADYQVNKGDIFIIMGGSGCGKSCSGGCDDGCTNNCDDLCGGDCWAYCESKYKS